MSHPNRIDYIEFTVTDLAAAKAFYGEAFGWLFQDYGPGYAGIRLPDREREIGGLRLADEESSPGAGGVLPVLWSDDLEASKAAVIAAGGGLTKDTFAFPGGRRFEARDPSGNPLAVWTES